MRSIGVAAMVLALGCSACGDADAPAAPPESPVTTTPGATPAPTPSAPPSTEAAATAPASSVPGSAAPSSTGPGTNPAIDRDAPTVSPQLAGSAVTEFGADLFAAATGVVDDEANLIVSPLSVAVAFGMLEPGASGDALTQLHDALRIDDPAEWHQSMNALEQSLEAAADRIAPTNDPSEDPGEYAANVANGIFVQPGYPIRTDYLDPLGRHYGAAVEPLDFAADQDAAAARLKKFVDEATEGRIPSIVDPDQIDPRTVLALVNALLVRASWQEAFDADDTTDGDFTLADGSSVTVPLMAGGSGRTGRGDGWIAASKGLVGQLALEVVLPDDGRFDDVAGRIGQVFAEFDITDGDAPATSALPGGRLVVPRFETRVSVPLTDVMTPLGLGALREPEGLLGVADDPRLVVDKALHETFLAVDETGLEAAAATLILAVVTSAPIGEPIDVVLDRPFLFRLVDQQSGATLLLGRVTDPTS